MADTGRSNSVRGRAQRRRVARVIDRFFDLGKRRQHLAPFYSHTGRPSIDPALMIRMRSLAACAVAWACGLPPLPRTPGSGVGARPRYAWARRIAWLADRQGCPPRCWLAS